MVKSPVVKLFHKPENSWETLTIFSIHDYLDRHILWKLHCLRMPSYEWARTLGFCYIGFQNIFNIFPSGNPGMSLNNSDYGRIVIWYKNICSRWTRFPKNVVHLYGWHFCCFELGGFFFHHHFEIFHYKTPPNLPQIKLAISPQNCKNSNWVTSTKIFLLVGSPSFPYLYKYNNACIVYHFLGW